MEKDSIILGTHGNNFHSDEVTTTAVLLKIFPKAKILRTRDKEVLKKADIIYDVNDGEYDHHSINRKTREDGLPYSSLGLIWKDFGMIYIEKMCPDAFDYEKDLMFEYIDTMFIKHIDASDNGYQHVTMDYKVLTYAGIVARMNGKYIEDAIDKEDVKEKQFLHAVQFADEILGYEIDKAWKIAQNRFDILEAIEASYGKRYLVLNKFAEVEFILHMENVDFDFVVYENNHETVSIRGIRKSILSTECKKYLPEEWRGKRLKELEEVTKIKGSLFCHASGFLGEHKTMKGAIKLLESIYK